jgi:hypothetical protein
LQYELKELQRRQEEEDRKHRGVRGYTPKTSPERIETTFPVESTGRHETYGGEHGGMFTVYQL